MDFLSIAIIALGIVVSGFVTINFIIESIKK